MRSRLALRALLVAALVGLVALGAVVAHPDLPVTRRLAGRLASSALTRALSGTVEVAPLSKLAWDRVQIPTVTVRDAEGREVLVLEDVKIVLSVPGLLRSVLLGDGPLLVVAEHARVERARATLLPSLGSPAPSLARALEPRRSSGGGGGGGRPARVLL
ncbi:MAG: hypothetical protein FJ104_15035, partial [Deltaproteobacteria bacterium]|nr:hypothetical protein [Deltaproteobacteria bacterium]